MAKTPCDRCGYDGQYIDTGRYVKFGDRPEKQFYLCNKCWDIVKDYFHHGPMPNYNPNTKPDPDAKKH